MTDFDRTTQLFPTAEVDDTDSTEAASDDYTQDAWSMLYGALVKGYGVSPDTFQLAYPYQAWNWTTQNLGYISPAQYDTLSVIPAWSATGKSVSTGSRFNDQYVAFLNVITPDSTDPALRKKLDQLYNDLTATTNTYDRTLQQAKSAYTADTDADKPKSFTQWLGTLDGRSWQTKLNALQRAMDQAQANYQAGVAESKTPNLVDALEAYGDEDYWSQLNDPNLATMPKVPNWSLPITPADWADRAANGDVPGGAIELSNADAKYDYTKTWAGGSAKVGTFFWQVEVNGSWERVTSFESDASLSVSVQFEGIEEIAIQPSPWYIGVSALADGPYKRGYSKDGAGGTKAVFGEEGFLPLLKTGMYVVYRPSFSIRVSHDTFTAFDQQFTASTGIRVGPFTFTAKGGADQAGWTASSTGMSFTGTTDSTEPFILGYTLKAMP